MSEEEVVINDPVEEKEVITPIYSEKEEKKPRGRKKAEKSTQKTPNYVFDPSAYKEIEKYEEHIPVRQLNRRGQLVVEQTPTGRFLEREVLAEAFVQKWGGGPRSNKNALHKAKCVFRTCEQFGVTPTRIKEAYSLLNGKKIDGYFITDLIDRFGWTNGEQMSRDMLRKRYNKTNVNSANVAQDKLCAILNSADVTKAYVDLVKDIKEEFALDMRDKVVYGE